MNKLLPVALALLLPFLAAADNEDSDQSEKELYKAAVFALEHGEYKLAYDRFEQLTKVDATNAEYYFLTGLSLYSAEVKMNEAVDYLYKSIEHFKGDTISEVYLYLGRACLETERFDEARVAYDMFKGLLKDNGAGEDLSARVDLELGWLDNAISQVDLMSFKVTSGNIEVTNLGDGINSEYGDYAPVELMNGQLAFTSRRQNNYGEKAFDGQFFEDIFFGEFDGVKWNALDRTDDRVIYDDYNTRGHDAFVESVSDGNTIYIYRKNGIYVSKFVDNAWTDLIEVEEVNKNSNHTPSVAISPDGTIMYFAHEERGGFGGKDLFVTTLGSNGEWNKPELLGSTINSELDEDAPFLTPDGETLYFSSKGHNSIGGFDFYKLDLTDPNAVPEHLPYPINSTSDDIFIVTDNYGERGFISSNRMSTLGGMDLYEFNMNPVAIETEVVGVAFDPTSDETVFPVISVIDTETGEVVTTFQPEEDGSYSFTVMSDKTYQFSVDEEGPNEFSNGWFVPKQTRQFDNHQILMLKDLKNEKDLVYAHVLEVRSSFEDIGGTEDWRSYMVAEMYEETEAFDYIHDTLFFDFANLAQEANYQKFYGYNLNQLDAADVELSAWFDKVETIVTYNGSITVVVHASASKVPTKTYGTNTKLAAVRADNAKQFIIKTLKDRGVDVNNVAFQVNSSVNGPSYRGDFESGVEEYEPFQYVKFSVAAE